MPDLIDKAFPQPTHRLGVLSKLAGTVLFHLQYIVFNGVWITCLVIVLRGKRLVFPGFHGLARKFGVES